MIDFLQKYAKAIVALLAPALVAIGASAGLNLSDEQALTLATLVTGFLVYLVPNKPPAQPGDIQAYIAGLEEKVKQMEASKTQELKSKKAGE